MYLTFIPLFFQLFPCIMSQIFHQLCPCIIPLLGGELPTDRLGGLVHPSYKWTTCPHKNPIEITRVN